MNDAFLLDISQRLGWTLVHSVWHFAIIALLLAFGLRLLRDCSSHLRYSFMLSTSAQVFERNEPLAAWR